MEHTGGGVRASGSATCQLWLRAVPSCLWAALSSLGGSTHLTDSTSASSFDPLKLVRKAYGSKIWVLRVINGLETLLPLLKNCCWRKDVRSHLGQGQRSVLGSQLRAQPLDPSLSPRAADQRGAGQQHVNESVLRHTFCNHSPQRRKRTTLRLGNGQGVTAAKPPPSFLGK